MVISVANATTALKIFERAGFKNAEGTAGDSALCEPAHLKIFGLIFLGRVGPQGLKLCQEKKYLFLFDKVA